FAAPADGSVRHWLRFDGINYRANIWLNGTQIASTRDIAGAYRRYEFDVTAVLRTDRPNALAIEVFAPEENDLGINWVDWNPTPPDKNMGLWRPVYLTGSGPIALRHSYVLTALNASHDAADLTAIADLWNTTDSPQTVVLRGVAADLKFSQNVTLAPSERKTVRVGGMHVGSPKVWWPYRMGAQPLYTASLEVVVGDVVSDRETIRFGIREVTSEL